MQTPTPAVPAAIEGGFCPDAVLAAAIAYAGLVKADGVTQSRTWLRVYRNGGCGTRNIVAFVHGDSAHVCRAESWKKPGRVIGNVFEIVARAKKAGAV